MRMQNKSKSILLISMPFAETSIPSIQLGLLDSYLTQNCITISTRHLYLQAANFYGLNNYNFLINDPNDSYTAQMIFSKYVFPNHWNKHIKKFQYYFENIMFNKQEYLKNFTFDYYIKQTDAFFEWSIRNINWTQYDAIGFTLNYGQLLPSLAIAKKVKEMYPEKQIIFGGSTIINELGKKILSIFKDIDFIVSGEGEIALLQLLKDFDNYQKIPGLIFRGKKEIIWNKNKIYIDMNYLPYPNFESYFKEMNNISDDIVQYYQLYGRIPIELSRGCWWNNCSFCNVSAYHRKYREKKYDRFIEELIYLSDIYRMLDFQVIGSTIPQNNFQELCEKIIKSDRDFNLVIESRAGVLKSSDYSLLRKAGFTHIQTGIEAFSSNYLKKMNKGTAVIENIAVLKFCKENHIKNSYNLIINYPNEEYIDFEETVKNVQLFQKYLEPPRISKFIVGYQSPIFNKLDEYNIDSLEPKKIDKIMYPENIYNQNFFFFSSFIRRETIDENRWNQLVAKWNEIYQEQKMTGIKRKTIIDELVFYFKDGITFLKIYDKRRNQNAMIYVLDETERDIFLSCTDIITYNDLKTRFPFINTYDFDQILENFIESGIIYKEENRYLSLPIDYQKFYNNFNNTKPCDIEDIRVYVENL